MRLGKVLFESAKQYAGIVLRREKDYNMLEDFAREFGAGCGHGFAGSKRTCYDANSAGGASGFSRHSMLDSSPQSSKRMVFRQGQNLGNGRSLQAGNQTSLRIDQA
jgi:hypothetical protein